MARQINPNLINDNLTNACDIAASIVRKLGFPSWLDTDEAEQIALVTLCECSLSFKSGNFQAYMRKAIINNLADAIKNQIKINQTYIEDNPELRETIW